MPLNMLSNHLLFSGIVILCFLSRHIVSNTFFNLYMIFDMFKPNSTLVFHCSNVPSCISRDDVSLKKNRRYVGNGNE